MLQMRYAAVVVFTIEVLLSHAPGTVSGEQSKYLSSMTGVKEGLLRRMAHVVLFVALSFTAASGFGVWGIGGVVVWSLLDEASKPIIPGRHFSWLDCGLNLIGTGVKLLNLYFEPDW